MKTETEITDYNEDNPGVRIQNNYDAEENVFASHGEAGQDISRIRCYTYNPNGCEYSCAVKPPFQNAGYWHSRDGVPRII